jgi:heme A synthase
MTEVSNGLLIVHSVLRWALLALLIVVIYQSFSAKGKRNYEGKDARLAKFTVLAAHLQLLIGFALYFMNGWHKFFSNMGEAMKQTGIRFFVIEHMLGMLVAIVLLTIGNAKAKRLQESEKKFKTIGIFFLIGLIVILATIPWPFREVFSQRGWL